MKIAIVCVEDGLMAVGTRKIAAYMKHLNPDTRSYYVTLTNARGLTNILLGKHGEAVDSFQEFLHGIAEPLTKADLICFSSMTAYAKLTAEIIAKVRELKPDAYIVWGGIHPIIVPEDAIKHADAVCTGEGEFAFETFFEKFKNGEDYTKTRNFWFRKGEEIIQNGFLPLMTSEEMGKLPLLQYGENEQIFDIEQGFREIRDDDYLEYNGLSYNTVWSIGCPFKCTYCGNTKFIENDETYRKIRHSPVEYILDEIEHALNTHPFISSICFHDDSFLALKPETLREFATKYRARFDTPFAIFGVIPNYVREEKIEILLEAGMNRVRMGLQNGSARILEFYDRPSPPKIMNHAAGVLRKYRRYMIPPAYDVILDNPIETKEDVVENLVFLKNLARPFTLNIFSLRSIPNTILEKQMEERDISIDKIAGNYAHNAPTLANCLIYIIAAIPIPDWLLSWVVKRAHPVTAEQTHYPRLLLFTRLIYLVKRALDHLLVMDFSVLTGKTGYVMWKLGIIQYWRRFFVPKFRPGEGSSLQQSS